jgi:hypothetical protein
LREGKLAGLQAVTLSLLNNNFCEVMRHVQIKAEIYQSLYIINQSLQLVTEHLEKLKAAEVLSADSAEILRLAAEQLRSEINQMATSRLHECECGDAYHFEQQRIEQESRVRGLDLIQNSTSPHNGVLLQPKN